MDRARNMVLASLIGDSTALGLHWIYNVGLIDKLSDDFSGLMAPKVKQYHGGKAKGQHTHYGDQTLWLLRSIAENGGFAADGYRELWLRNMQEYEGYLDHATKDTLEHPDAGSDSDELAGAVRIAPVLYARRADKDAAISGAGGQTAITHNNPLTIEVAGSLAAITLDVLSGTSPSDAIKRHAESLSQDNPLAEMFNRGIESAGKDTRETVLAFGQMCSAKAALPSAVHIVLSYPDDLKKALSQNVLAGGDQAARGMAIGMILGAAGCEIPQGWLADYAYVDEVKELLDSVG